MKAFLLQSAVFMLPLLGALHLLTFALIRRKWGLVALGAGLAAFFILVFKPFATLLPHLAMDSFREGLSFDPAEAYFYLTTLGYGDYGLKNLLVWGAIFLAYAVFVMVLLRFGGAGWHARSRAKIHALLVVLLIVPATAYAGAFAISGFARASAQLGAVAANYRGHADGLSVVADPENDLSVMLYVGESATRQHWSLYGYPRATTRALERPEWSSGLIRFDQTNSTSVHTSPSLLEALSIDGEPATMAARAETDAPRSIYERKRVPVPDILALRGIETALYSNQGRHGTWNMASQILFRQARRRFYSTSRTLGSADYLDDERPYDHVLLERFWSDYRAGKMAGSRLLVFHSYAGHGGPDGYAGAVPAAYRRKVDDSLSGLTPQAVLGAASDPANVEWTEAYDAAMRYVADNVAHAFAQADRQDAPMAVVFFSDHGESVFTGAGHDSARYAWEMSAVPLLVYFNRAARQAFPERVNRYRRIAAQASPASLANLPSLLFDLLGVTVRLPDGSLHRASQCEFGSGACLPAYRNIRERVDGTVSYVRASPGPALSSAGQAMLDTSDRATSLANLVVAAGDRADAPQMCFHRANSIASIVRARAITPCLEMDVTVDDRRLFVHHSSAPNVGLTLDKALAFISDRRSVVWLDGKNLHVPGNCAVLADFLDRRRGGGIAFFVEFSSRSAERLDELRTCARRLSNAGATLSYYVPTEPAMRCSQALSDGRRDESCVQVARALDAVLQSGMFTDISFDHAALPAIERHPDARSVRWNTWFVPDANIPQLRARRYRLVIPFGSDPNAN